MENNKNHTEVKVDSLLFDSSIKELAIFVDRLFHILIKVSYCCYSFRVMVVKYSVFLIFVYLTGENVLEK